MKESTRMKTLDFSVVGPYVLCAVAADGTCDTDGETA